MNIIAVRKILKKFDKRMTEYSIPMKDKYLESWMFAIQLQPVRKSLNEEYSNANLSELPSEN
jgi:hypothetical protein